MFQKILSVILVICLMQICLYGQSTLQNTIRGKVVSEKNTQKGLELVQIILIKMQDSSTVADALTDSLGFFEINLDEKGNYLIECTYLGYETKRSKPFSYIPDSHPHLMPTIALKETEIGLDQVDIVERKAEYVAKLDKKVINLADNVNTKGTTLYDMLSTLPSIDVDDEGNINLRGNSNVRILIDGRNSGFSSISALKQIPASSVDKIEIINNPSSKYDAEGNAGIINIIMKKDSQVNSNGTAYIGYVRGAFNRYNAGINYNMKWRRWAFFGGYTYQNNPTFSNGFSQRSIITRDSFYTNRQNTDEKRTDLNHGVKVGVDFFQNSLNTFYTSLNYRISPKIVSEQESDFLYWPFNSNDNFGLASRSGLTEQSKTGIDFSLGWQRKFNTPNKQLDFDLLVSDSKDLDDSRYDQKNLITNNSFTGISELPQKVFLDEYKRIYVGRLDYAHPLTKDKKIETGLLISFRNLHNIIGSETFDTLSGAFKNDAGISNDFKYDEVISAAYGIWKHKWKKYEYHVGLRVENTQTTTLLLNETPNDRNYIDFFPTIQIQRKLSEGFDILLAYSRRINRPSIGQLNPFVNLSDAYSIRTGNPNLKPEYVNNLELGYIKYWKKLSLNQSFYYRHINNSFRRTVTANYVTGGTMVKFDNLSSAELYGTEMVLNANFSKAWKANSTINLYQQFYNDDYLIYNNGALYMTVQLGATYNINPQWSIQFNGRYNAPFVTPQGKIKAMGNGNLAFRYGAKNDRWNIVMRLADIFKTQTFNIYSTSDPNYFFEGYRRGDNTNVGLTFTYNLGKASKPIKSVRKEEEKQPQMVDPGG